MYLGIYSRYVIDKCMFETGGIYARYGLRYRVVKIVYVLFRIILRR